MVWQDVGCVKLACSTTMHTPTTHPPNLPRIKQSTMVQLTTLCAFLIRACQCSGNLWMSPNFRKLTAPKSGAAPVKMMLNRPSCSAVGKGGWGLGNAWGHGRRVCAVRTKAVG